MNSKFTCCFFCDIIIFKEGDDIIKRLFLISLVIVPFIFLSACNRNHEEWEGLTGKYYVTFVSIDGVAIDLDESKSYINLEIDENGNCFGSTAIAYADGSFANVAPIVDWWYDDEGTIVIEYDDGNTNTFEIVEYGNTIKQDYDGEIVIAEKQNDE